MANLGYIQVTRQCTQRCRFCSNPPVEAERSLDEARALADDLKARGYDGVILTGGEPTLAPWLPELVAHCSAADLPPRLITNGTLLCEPDRLDRLIDAGLGHVHLSVHSHLAAVHDGLTRNPGSHAALVATLELIAARAGRITADVNAVMTTENVGRLDELVAWVIDRFPFVRHFVLNGLDPDTDRLRESPELIPRLWQVELPLARAEALIEAAGRTLRVERVPLCYMEGFEHCSTETRKLVKGEERTTHFLDRRGAVRQGPGGFVHRHHEACEPCTLRPICAGLHDAAGAYDPAELAAQFVDPEPIRRRVRGPRG